MDNYNEFENEMNTETTTANDYQGAEKAESNGNTAVSVKGKAVTALNEARDRAVEMKDKLGERAAKASSQFGETIDSNRGKASQGLRSTSARIESVATYLDEHNSKDMGDALIQGTEQLIRKHPGKSLIAGLLVGLMIGRAFSR